MLTLVNSHLGWYMKYPKFCNLYNKIPGHVDRYWIYIQVIFWISYFLELLKVILALVQQSHETFLNQFSFGNYPVGYLQIRGWKVLNHLLKMLDNFRLYSCGYNETCLSRFLLILHQSCFFLKLDNIFEIYLCYCLYLFIAQ